MRLTELNGFKLPACLLLLVVVPSLLVWPGLSGPLVYDDYTNLAPLLTEEPEYLRTIFENDSGPLGRIVTMGSFVANHWYSNGLDVFQLKFTNLVIHIMNGLLLFILLLKLLKDKFSPGNTVRHLNPLLLYVNDSSEPLY